MSSQEACSKACSIYTLCPDGDPSGDPECEESQLEGSVATSFQWEVMQVPHPTSSFLPSLFLSTAKFRLCGEARLP